MSKADTHYYYGRAAVGQGYTLGNEYRTNIMGEPSADPLRADCSGYEIGLWKLADARFNKAGAWVTYSSFFGTTRPTANTMYQKTKAGRVAQPTKYGTLGFLLRSDGTAKHVFHYAGNGRTLEAGDGTGKIARHTVAWQNARGAVWCELPHDMGELTPHEGTPTYPAGVPLLKYGSVNDYVREWKSLLNQVLSAGLSIGYTTTARTFGPSTRTATKNFQTAYGLFASGVVDASTVQAMQKAIL